MEVASLGAVAGACHALTGPDHLAVLLPYCVGRPMKQAWKAGARWGVGHGLGASLFGLIAFHFKEILLLHSFARFMDLVVGLTLVLIGARGLMDIRSTLSSSSSRQQDGMTRGSRSVGGNVGSRGVKSESVSRDEAPLLLRNGKGTVANGESVGGGEPSGRRQRSPIAGVGDGSSSNTSSSCSSCSCGNDSDMLCHDAVGDRRETEMSLLERGGQAKAEGAQCELCSLGTNDNGLASDVNHNNSSSSSNKSSCCLCGQTDPTARSSRRRRGSGSGALSGWSRRLTWRGREADGTSVTLTGVGAGAGAGVGVASELSPWAFLCTGVVHGLSGTGHLVGVIPALTMPDLFQVSSYLLSFCLGTAVAMTIFTACVALVSSRVQSGVGLNAVRRISQASSVFALLLGCVLIGQWGIATFVWPTNEEDGALK